MTRFELWFVTYYHCGRPMKWQEFPTRYECANPECRATR